MTKEQTKEAIKVMQAYVDGKTIEYRPFNSAEEVMEAIKVHGDWVSHNGRYYRIIEITDKGCSIGTDRALWKLSECVSNWTFADGTPFGKLEE